LNKPSPNGSESRADNINRSTKIRLWAALILSIATAVLNASFGRWLSVGIAAAAPAGLCVLLFARKKWRFALMCV
jgi:hypothetical protein